MTATALRLRRAHTGDSYALWLWANDEATRRASFGRGAIPWSEHVAWLERTLGDASAFVFIGEVCGRPVATIRFDTTDAWSTARLSYVVAPEARGVGMSKPLVAQGVASLRQSHPRVAVRAEVVDGNDRSRRVFLGAGWTEERVRDGVAEFWDRGP